MADEQNKKNKMSGNMGGGSAVYCMGLIGALVYYIQNADTIGQGLIGVFKAILWPAFVVYKSLPLLNL